MRFPGALGMVLLLYLLVLLPWAAWRSARHLRAARSGTAPPGARPIPSRTQIFATTLAMLAMLFWLAWITGRTFGYDIFAIPSFGLRELLAGLAAFAAQLGLRRVNRAIRTEEERRKMPVYGLLPRTRTEWTLYLVTAIAAGLAEEAAYRGVGMSVLTWSTGSAPLSALILAVAFGLAHLIQEWKSVGIIFLMALLMHTLVWFTGTLVVAMVVHAVYDIVAGIVGSRDAIRFEREAAVAAAGPTPIP